MVCLMVCLRWRKRRTARWTRGSDSPHRAVPYQRRNEIRLSTPPRLSANVNNRQRSRKLVRRRESRRPRLRSSRRMRASAGAPAHAVDGREGLDNAHGVSVDAQRATARCAAPTPIAAPCAKARPMATSSQALRVCGAGPLPFSEGFSQNGTSPEYAQANVHRENGVDDHLILASTATYSKFPPPKA